MIRLACHFALLCKQTQNFIWHQHFSRCLISRLLPLFVSLSLSPRFSCANFPRWLIAYHLPTTKYPSFVLRHEILQSTLVLTESLWDRVKNHVRDGKNKNKTTQNSRERRNWMVFVCKIFVISLCLLSIYQIKHDHAVFSPVFFFKNKRQKWICTKFMRSVKVAQYLLHKSFGFSYTVSSACVQIFLDFRFSIYRIDGLCFRFS